MASNIITDIRQSLNALQAWLAPYARLARAVPLKVWLASGALLLAGLWLQEHDARVRAATELHRVQQQSAQQVSQLRSQAETAVRDANVRNAATIAGLEAERQKLARQAEGLSAQLEQLKRQESVETQKVAALPPAELAKTLAGQLGPGSVLTGPFPGSAASGQLSLSEQGQRQVASALLERDSCRGQAAIRDRQFANCRDQLAAGAGEIQTQADSLAKLNQALSAKDRILAEREAEFKTELTAARGKWHSRAFRALKYIALGMGLGMAVR
jgi:hypothetical protein